jgi:hypothetical protein
LCKPKKIGWRYRGRHRSDIRVRRHSEISPNTCKRYAIGSDTPLGIEVTRKKSKSQRQHLRAAEALALSRFSGGIEHAGSCFTMFRHIHDRSITRTATLPRSRRAIIKADSTSQLPRKLVRGQTSSTLDLMSNDGGTVRRRNPGSTGATGIQ